MARIYATRPQVRAMAAHGAEVVDGRSAALRAVLAAAGPGRAPVPPLELTPRRVWPRSSAAASSRSSGGCGTRRTARSSSRRAADGIEVPAVYKPRARRAAAVGLPRRHALPARGRGVELSDGLGWGRRARHRARATTARSAMGALQRFVEHDPEEHYFTLLAGNEDRFRAVRRVRHPRQQHRPQGRPLPPRPCPTTTIVGIDHGLTFHRMWKLRTVIWDFADEPVPRRSLDDVRRVVAELDDGRARGGDSARCSRPPSSRPLGDPRRRPPPRRPLPRARARLPLRPLAAGLNCLMRASSRGTQVMV